LEGSESKDKYLTDLLKKRGPNAWDTISVWLERKVGRH
jgi:hypothetical protein